jgi:hypothetical protein
MNLLVGWKYCMNNVTLKDMFALVLAFFCFYALEGSHGCIFFTGYLSCVEY